MTYRIGHSFALGSCIIKFIMATVIIGDSQNKYLHRNVRDFGIPMPSYSDYKIEELALDDTINSAFSRFEVGPCYCMFSCHFYIAAC